MTTSGNPATDALLPANYRLGNLKGKAECKRALRASLGLDNAAEGPLFCVVSRITEQKGLHLVLQVVEDIVARGGQFALIGSGDPGMEAAFLRWRKRIRNRFRCASATTRASPTA